MKPETWYEAAYKAHGLSAQRRYPNEELVRFFGRNYFRVPREERDDISILEVGCGCGANLGMVAAEGFDAHGIDLSRESVDLCGQALRARGLNATLRTADMTDIPYANGSLNAILDVFSSNCLDEKGGDLFLSEVSRTLKTGGRFFSYFPSKASDAFKSHDPSILLDGSTLDGIRRETSPYFGNLYPFRFTTPNDYATAIERAGLTVTYCETVSRTYRNRRELFEFVVIEAHC